MKTRSFPLAYRATRALGRALVTLSVVTAAHAQRPVHPAPPPSANGPAKVVETATFHTGGGIIMWLRATDAGTVLVYAARGIRNPFAQPSVLSAEDTDRWAEIAASLVAAAEGSGPVPVLRSGSAAGSSAGSAVLGGGDVVLDVASPAASPVVSMRIGASGPQALSTTLSAALLHEVVPALRETARLAREMAAERLAAHGLGRGAREVGAPESAVRGRRPESRGPAAPAALVTPAAPAAPAALASRTATGAPVRLPAPATQTPMAMSPPTRSPSAGVARPDLRQIAPELPEPVSVTPSAVPIALAPNAPRGVSDLPATPAASGAPAAIVVGVPLMTGRLSPAAIGDVARKRQPLLAYCYTHFGLSADSTLQGRVSMRVALSAEGDVMHAEVADRHWWGRGGDGVEECVRGRVSLWRFPAAPHAGIYEFQLYFNK